MMDDFKPKKPVSPARISRPEDPPVEPSTDDEIGEAFASPEQAAAADPVDETIVLEEPTAAAAAVAAEPPAAETSRADRPAKTKWQWWPPKAWVRKQWLVVAGLAVTVAAIVTVLALVVFHKKPAKQAPAPQKAAVVAPVKPTTVPSRLTGLPVTPEQSRLPVTGIMIENSLDARPQSGLDQAGVIYEAVAEGGVTRFLALFEENQPDYVGPVRSARPYYIRWLLPFDAAYAHVGGSPAALADIKTLHVKDLDEFSNGGSYKRITSRAAPHNVYTSLSQLLALEKTKKYDQSNFTGFPRKAEAPSKAPNATSIDVTISGPLYSSHYDYDAGTNSYKRSEGGVPHMVVNKLGQQTQLQPKVVLVLVIPQSNGEPTASGAYYTTYDTIGTGELYLFEDGVITMGSWSKADDKSQFSFSDSVGKPLAINPGQTWISVVGLSGDVTYK